MMRLAAIILLAFLYAGVVFCICSFRRIQEALFNLFSKSRIEFLRKKQADHPIDGSYVDAAIANAMEPILNAWRDADEKKLPGRMDKTFLERMQRSIRVLKKNGIRRNLKFSGCITESEGKDRKAGFRKWSEGGREWREGVLSSSMLDAYTDSRSGEILQDQYYRNVRMSVVQSRHIRYEDAKREAESRKDKFGYMKKKKAETAFYEESKHIVCNSCGAPLEINAQQVTCPYCGGQLFSEFHDWQTEHFALEPVTQYPWSRGVICALIAFAASFLVHLLEWLVFRRADFSVAASAVVAVATAAAVFGYRFVLDSIQEKRKKQIVRFSLHQFKTCMYEELWKKFKNLDVLDFFIGDITIKAVRHTEDTTELTVSAPLYTQIYRNGAVAFEKTKWKGVFTRARYPERLKSKGAIVEERQCPSCAANFVPDAHGCCSFCGYSYHISNAKWKLKQQP